MHKTFIFSFVIYGSTSLKIHYNKTNTVVWMASREQPVNGKLSKLSLRSGNMVLVDAGQITT